MNALVRPHPPEAALAEEVAVAEPEGPAHQLIRLGSQRR